MSGLTKALRNSLIGDLVLAGLVDTTSPTPAGTVTAVMPANRDFLEVIAGRGGKWNPPLLGVAYAGREKGGPVEGGGLLHDATANMIVFILVRELSGLDEELDELADLTDLVIDAVAGKAPLLRGRDGALIGEETLIGDRWAYRGDNPVELPPEALGKNLRVWAVHFSTTVLIAPDRADTAHEPLEGMDGTIDPRPGASPATPAADMIEFAFDAED